MQENEVSANVSARARTPRKKKKSQIPYGFLAVLIAVMIAVFLVGRNEMLAVFWVFGCIFGYVLQRSRFCFTASMRDPCITGSTSITRAVLTAIAIATIGFTAIKYGAFVNGQPIPGQSYIAPISPATAVGGLIFGIGMVIAGGCASGTLMRVGEGFSVQLLGLLFFMIGSLVGAHDMGWWTLNFIATAPKVFLPDVFGWGRALVLQLGLILILYIVADKFEKKRMGISEEE